VRVRVVPQRLGTFVSDPDDLNRLAAQQTRTPRKGQMGLDVPLSDVHSADISEKGPRWVSPGERTTLEFRSAEDIRTIAWTVADGTIDPATFEATGRTLTFTAPHKRGATALIQAVATMRDGDLIQRTKLIAVSTTQDSPLVGEGAPDANTTAFCALVAEASDGPATVTFLDGATLTMPQTVLPDGVTCDQADASLTLQKAVLAYAGATFNDVSGTITTGGVSIQTATYQLPASLQKWAQLVYDRGPVSLPVAPIDGTVAATLRGGVWQQVTGQVAVLPFATSDDASKGYDDALAFLPLPGGWKFGKNSSRLTFSAEVPEGSQTPVAKLFFQQAAQGPDGSSGSALFDLVMVNGTVSKVEVTAANVGIFGNIDGDQISASGKGSFTIGDDGTLNVDGLSFGADCSDPKGCELVSGLVFSKGSLDWTPSQIALNFAGLVVTGQGSYGLAGSGTYASATQWSLELKSSTPWVMGTSGVTLSGLDGKLAWVPQEETEQADGVDDDAPPAPAQSRIDFTVAGAATLQKDSSNTVTLNKVSGYVTNECTDASVAAKTCDRGQVRIDLDADASVRMPGSSSAQDVALTATLNLSTLAFTFSGNLTGMAFGPSAFQINGVALTLSNTGQGACMPTGSKQPTTGLVVGLNASGVLLGQKARMSGMVRQEGYCLWGGLDAVTVGGATVSGPSFAYATFDATISGTPGVSASAIRTAVNSVSLVGDFQMPASVEKLLPTGGHGQFLAQMTTDAKTFTGSVSYVWDDPVWLMSGGTSNTNLGLKSAGMQVTMNTDKGSVSMVMNATADIFVPAKPDKGLAQSSTPMFVKIGISAGSDGANLDFAVGVDPATGNASTGTIQNAFGQPGMQVKALALSGSIGTKNELDFFADVVFPTSWQEKIAITAADADIKFGLSLNVTNPGQSCLLFELGTPSTWQEVYAAYDDSKTVVDIANKGIVRARYFKLAIAPSGCTLPSGLNSTYVVPAGYAFAFDGQILGARVLVQVDVQLPSPANNESLKITGALAVDSLSVAGAKLTGSQHAGQPGCDNSDGPRLFVNIDTAASAYLFKLSARIEVGKVPIAGAFIDVCGTIDAQGSTISADFYGNGEMKLIGLGTKADLTLHMQMAGGKLQYANVAMDYSTDILFMTFRGSANLLYQDSRLQVFRASIGAGVNFLIGKLEGDVAVGYCLGKWTTDVRNPTCDLGGSTPQGANVRVDLWGSLRFLFWKKAFAKTVYDNQSAGKTNVPAYLGRQPRATSITLAAMQRTYDSMGKYMPRGDYDEDHPWDKYYMLKVNKPDGANPCQTSGATVDWTQEATSPQAMTVIVPDPDECTLAVFIAWGTRSASGAITWQPPQPYQVWCTADGCFLSEDAGALDGFLDDLSKPKFGALPPEYYGGYDRDRSKASMTKIMGALGEPGTPPGVLPSGSAVGPGLPVETLLSANGRYQLEVGGTDGDIQIRDLFTQSIIWHTGANLHDPGTSPPALVMGTDGSLRVQCSNCEDVYWSTDTAGIAGQGAQMYLTDIGTIQVEQSMGKGNYTPVWSTELTLQNATTGYCMDAKDFDSNGWPKYGSRVVQQACNGKPSQSYLAEPVEAPGNWTWNGASWLHNPAFRLHTGWQQQLCPTVDSNGSNQPMSLRTCGDGSYSPNQAFRLTTQSAGDPLQVTLEYVRPDGGGVRWIAPDGGSKNNFLRTDQSKGGREIWDRTN
jgi:hypothetical protein